MPQLREFMESAQSGIGGMLSMFTGGALGRMGILLLGSCPIFPHLLLFSC